MNKVQSHKKFFFCFFSRFGGVNKSKFSSLNCAYNKGDSKENVNKNRKIVLDLFKKKKLIIPNQTHSNIVFKLKENNYQPAEADAVISDRKDVLLGILTADCAPVIILGNKIYGIVHAGWRGLLDNILEKSINKIISNGEKIGSLNVFVGPHLKKKSFEVKDNFIKKLKEKKIDPQNYIINKNRRYYFDFTKLIITKLKNSGIEKVKISNKNTFTNPDHFFSYRYCRTNKIKNCGRQISIVGIKNM